MLIGEHTGYLRELFRYAQRILGAKASYKDLAETMNLKSEAPGEIRTSLSLHSLQVYRWFVLEGGKEHSPKEKPLDTNAHKQMRLAWVKKFWEVFTDPTLPVCHLDEKWFYITNRRRKIKRLPIGPEEVPGCAFIPSPKMRSRRYPVKCMFLGCVANPQPERNFDGRIHLERISTPTTTKQKSHHSRFSDDVNINNRIKNGGWRECILQETETTTEEHAESIGAAFDLDDAVIDRLVFYYRTYVGDDGGNKLVYLKDNGTISGIRRNNKDSSAPPVAVTIKDVSIKVEVVKGETMEVDCSCDSAYMMMAMDRVGKKIRLAFHWIEKKDPCYLNMDNAGGHGTNVAIEAYTKMLKDKYNVIIIHQVPRSPYTNLLDLGVWCTLQWYVEKEHYMKRTDVHALVNSVERAWNNKSLNESIGRVWGRLRNVLVLIVEGDGGNDLVEKKRGKRFRNLDLSPDFLSNNDEVSTVTNAAITTPVNNCIHLDMEEDDSDDEEGLMSDLI